MQQYLAVEMIASWANLNQMFSLLCFGSYIVFQRWMFLKHILCINLPNVQYEIFAVYISEQINNIVFGW